MEITIGDEVHGREGALGTVKRFLIDPRTGTVEHIVVDPGVFQGERIVPIERIHSLPDAGVGVDMSHDEFKALEVYNDAVFRAKDTDYTGPPGFDTEGTERGEFLMDETVAMGSAAFTTGKPMGYPGGEQLIPDDKQFPAVAHGTDVVDVDGEKVGSIGSFTIDATRGVPTRLTLRRGLILANETEIPIAWFDEVRPGRVVLNAKKEEVDALERAA